ncbi:MAG: DoxX family membrane protein [Bifidobacteriaceae bacterium]|jgi:uncharacterized membrane protein YphA (DoxX/SURF4 family)|nr:DoxX family membrane protein [Bifidobacteriaceae bacterium]
MKLLRGIARRFVASWFIAEGIGVVRHPEPHAELAAPFAERLSGATGLPDSPAAMVRTAGAGLAAAGAAIALGVVPRLAGASAAIVLGVVAEAGYPFWSERDPERRREVLAGFLTRVALTGAALLIATDTSARDARRLAAVRRAPRKA